MFRTFLLYFFCISLSLTFQGCEKNKPAELPRLPGIQTSISEIQISPLAYDRATVTLKGIIKEIKDVDNTNNKHMIVITDQYENTLDLKYSGDTENISAGDLVVVSGIYDKATNSVITDRIAKVPVKPDK